MKKIILLFFLLLGVRESSFAATSFNLDMPHPRLPEISLPEEVPAPDPPQVRTFCAQELPCASTANNTHSGSETFTGNVIATAGQNSINAYKFNNFLYVDGIKYTTLAAAFADLPAAGGTVFDCFPETWNADPFVAMAKPFKLIFCNNIAVQWITNVPLAIRNNGQIISGGGPNGTQIAASPTFPINSYVISMGLPYPGIYGSRIEDIAISCGLAPVVGCGAVNFDGMQELSGALRIQGVNCTTTLGCIRISSDQGAGATQDTLTFQGIGGIMFAGANQSCVGPVIEVAAGAISKINIQDVTAIGVAGGCGGPITPAGIQMDSPFEANLAAIHGEQVTSVILSNTTANVQITQVTGHTSTPNVFTSTAAGGNWNVNDLFASGCTNNTLNDTGDSLFSACPNNVTFEARSGVSSPSTFGSVPTIGWVQTVPNGAGVGFTQRLLAGFTPSSKSFGLFDTNGTDLNFAILNDGRFQSRGGQAAAFSQVFANSLLTANRTTTFSDISGLAMTEASAVPANTILKALDSTHASSTATGITEVGTTISTADTITSTGTINCTIINAIRCVSPSNPQGWAGADIGAWLNAAYANLPAAGGRIQIASNSSCYTFTTPIVFGTNLKPVSVEGDGYSTCLNYTAASGIAILIDWGTGERVGHGLEKLWLEGPGGSVGSGTGIGIQVGSTNGADFVTLTSVKVTGFQTGLFSNNGNSFLLRVDKSQFGGNIQNVLMSGGLENNTFTDSLFNNYTNANQVNSVQITSAGDYHFKDCSFDDAQLSVGSAANVSVLGGHFENPTLGTNYAFWNFTGSNSLAFVAVNFLQDKVAAAPAQVGTINGNGTLSYFQTSYFSGAIQTNNITISGGNPNITVIGAQDGSINYSGPYIGGVTTGQIVTLPEPKIKTYAFGTSGGFDSTQKQFFIGGVPGASNILQFSYNPAATVGGVVGNLASLTQSNVANECVWDTSANMGCAGFLGATNGFRPGAAGAADLGTTLLPFGNLWLGTAATNNFKFQPAATAAARVISILDPGAASTLDLTSNTTTTATQVLHGSATAGLGTWSAVATADIATALTTPGPIGGTTPSTGKFTTITETNLLISSTAPTIAGAGCGGSAATIASNNGTADFTINTGTAPTSGGCTVTMPAATTAWDCSVNDITTTSATVFLQKKTGGSTTSVILQNFSTTPAAAAPVANDIWEVRCTAR